MKDEGEKSKEFFLQLALYTWSSPGKIRSCWLEECEVLPLTEIFAGNHSRSSRAWIYTEIGLRSKIFWALEEQTGTKESDKRRKTDHKTVSTWLTLHSWNHIFEQGKLRTLKRMRTLRICAHKLITISRMLVAKCFVRFRLFIASIGVPMQLAEWTLGSTKMSIVLISCWIKVSKFQW